MAVVVWVGVCQFLDRSKCVHLCHRSRGWEGDGLCAVTRVAGPKSLENGGGGRGRTWCVGGLVVVVVIISVVGMPLWPSGGLGLPVMGAADMSCCCALADAGLWGGGDGGLRLAGPVVGGKGTGVCIYVCLK